jgi:ureidoglycolate lyase
VRLPLLAPDAALFAPYGAFVDVPAQVGVRRIYSEWLAPVPGLVPQFHTNRVAPSALPLTIDRVERHPHAAQVFLPLDVGRYVVTVMAADAAGAPDPASARAFLLPATLGVVYRAGVWHAGMTVLDAAASFGVMMWRGAADDDVFAAIPPVVVVAPAPVDAAGGARG